MFYQYLIMFALFFISSCGNSQELSKNEAMLISNLVENVQAHHLAAQELNDDLSVKIFNSFLKKVDPDKKIFTLEEIDQLKLREKQLDDEFLNGTTHFFNEAFEILSNGIVRAEQFADHSLQNDIDINKDDYLESNNDKIEFASGKVLEKRWDLVVKQQFMEQLYIAQISEPTLPLEAQKAMALEKAKIFFNNYFNDLKYLSREEWLETYLNAYVSCNDYQSTFLSPEAKAKWNDLFNRTFVGVGLSIETTIDYPIIKDVVFNGPAWKTKKLHGGDILMKISNDKNELIDVAGFPIKEIIGLLKGEKGSSVSVRIKNSKNEVEEVSIERDQVLMSQTMSFVLEDKNQQAKIGYISLPRFYIGNGGCSSHVLKELRALNERKVEGIIFDLRNNQGGSSREAVEMIGYFLKGGIVMQTVHSDGEHNIIEDEDESAQYSGKLIVLVNEKSGSASELLSGTLQDYDRAIIVGNQTVGKGTMQNFFEIEDEENSIKFGEVKLSIAKFFTGNGRSAQYHGITPDIILPSENKYITTGERAVENALKFEDLKPSITVKNQSIEASISQLVALSTERCTKNPYFQGIEKEALRKKKQQETPLVSLNYKTFQLKKEESKKNTVSNQSSQRINITDLSSSKSDPEKTAYWKLKLGADEYLYESMLIMNDFLGMDG